MKRMRKSIRTLARTIYIKNKKSKNLTLALVLIMICCIGWNKQPVHNTEQLAGLYLMQDSNKLGWELLDLNQDGNYFYFLHSDILDVGSAGTWVKEGNEIFLTYVPFPLQIAYVKILHSHLNLLYRTKKPLINIKRKLVLLIVSAR